MEVYTKIWKVGLFMTKLKYKEIPLYNIFCGCLVYILFFKGYTLIGSFNAPFEYGGVIYDILKEILDIGNILVQGLAGSIIFYYVVEYRNFKINIQNYIDFKNNMIFLVDDNTRFLKRIFNINDMKTYQESIIDKIDSYNSQLMQNNIKLIIQNKDKLRQCLCDNEQFLKMLKENFDKSVGNIKKSDLKFIQFDEIIKTYNSLKPVEMAIDKTYNSYFDTSFDLKDLLSMYFEYFSLCLILYDKLDNVINCKFIGFLRMLK